MNGAGSENLGFSCPSIEVVRQRQGRGRPLRLAAEAEVPPAFRRWSSLIALATFNASDELTTVRELAFCGRVAVRTLDYRCEAVGVRARDCVGFVRCLRLVLDTEGRWAPTHRLSASDPRTVRRLITRSGLGDSRPDLQTFVRTQLFIEDRRLLDALAAEVEQRRQSAYLRSAVRNDVRVDADAGPRSR